MVMFPVVGYKHALIYSQDVERSEHRYDRSKKAKILTMGAG